MGAFHTACAFLAVIGKHFAGNGIVELLVESGVAGSNAAEHFLSGKPYNRALRLQKLLYEVMAQLNLQACEATTASAPSEVHEALDYILCDS